jgi:hypothetical protein
MKRATLIPSLQSNALVREIEHQLKTENEAIAAAVRRDAHEITAQARAAARRQMHAAIVALRKEGALRLTRAKAQLDTASRARAQHRAADAVHAALPLLGEALATRWRDPDARRTWTDAVAALCADRLRRGAWLVEHPADWSTQEQQQFIAAIGNGNDVSFQAKTDVGSGLRVKADQAVLDATPHGLLADRTAIAALLLDQIGDGAA